MDSQGLFSTCRLTTWRHHNWPPLLPLALDGYCRDNVDVLCRACQTIFRDYGKWPGQFGALTLQQHHDRLESLVMAVKGNCALCQLIALNWPLDWDSDFLSHALSPPAFEMIKKIDAKNRLGTEANVDWQREATRKLIMFVRGRQVEFTVQPAGIKEI